MMVANVAEAADWRALGASAFIVSSDQGLMRMAAAKVADDSQKPENRKRLKERNRHEECTMTTSASTDLIEQRIDDLLVGAIDPHVHSGPSIAARSVDHLELAREARRRAWRRS